MARYEKDGAAFSLPEPLTVRKVLQYDSVLELTQTDKPGYERLWQAARTVITEWAAPFALDANLDELAIEHLDVIKWAGMQVLAHVQAVKQLPKN